MLDGLCDAIEVVTEAIDHLCGTCSGQTPSPGPTGSGTVSTSFSNSPGSPGNDRPGDRSPGDRNRRDRTPDDPGREVTDDTPDWDDPDYEWTLQRDNLIWRTIDAGSELAMIPFKHIGKLLGPVLTVAEATPAVTTGVTNIHKDTRGEGGRIELMDAIHDVGQGRTTHDDPRLGRIGGGQ